LGLGWGCGGEEGEERRGEDRGRSGLRRGRELVEERDVEDDVELPRGGARHRAGIRQ
jgi:hypothetical protein